jgi:hypothetical protein
MSLHLWESALHNRRVFISGLAVSDLRALAIEGFAAIPRRGLEVGGILMGEVHNGDVRIAAFEAVPCEHHFGPSYTLSESERTKLIEILRERRCGMLSVVGLFQSFTGRDPVIDEADEALMREHFSHGESVYLTIQPLSIERCSASFSLFRNGELIPDLQQPFELSQASLPIAQLAEPAAEMPATEAEPESEPVHHHPVPLPPPHRTRDHAPEFAPVLTTTSHSRWWAAAIFCAVLGIGAGVVYGLRTPQPAEWPDLHLDARPVENGTLLLTWDAAVARTATAARLNVTDGAVRRDIDLKPDEIRAGRTQFTPLHSEVALRLTLRDHGATVARDGIRLIATPPPQPVVAKPAAPAEESEPEQPVTAAAVNATHEVQPVVPAGIRSRIMEPVVIPVTVEVNAQGRVVRASVPSTEDGLNRYLAGLAQKSAREWRFHPARSKSGRAVASRRTIRFTFAP